MPPTAKSDRDGLSSPNGVAALRGPYGELIRGLAVP